MSQFDDLRCAACEHAPESHHAGEGQCYKCPADHRCTRYVRKPLASQVVVREATAKDYQ
jgi:hypothetical protein